LSEKQEKNTRRAMEELHQAAALPTDYGLTINGQKFRAIGHNITGTMFIVHEASGEVHFIPIARVQRAVLDTDYKVIMSAQREAAAQAIAQQHGQTPRKLEVVRPEVGPPEPEGA
jgi:hypothetical protein